MKAEFHILRVFKRLQARLFCPQRIPPVHDNHARCNAAENCRLCRGRIAAADHYDRFSLIKHAVARRAVANAAADHLLLAGNAQFSRGCAGGDYHRFRIQRARIRADFLHLALQLHGLNLGILRFRAEALRLPLHLCAQLKAVNPLFKPGVIIDLMRQRHLSAGRQLFNHQRIKPCARCIQRRRIAARPAADHDHIIYLHPPVPLAFVDSSIPRSGRFFRDLVTFIQNRTNRHAAGGFIRKSLYGFCLGG